MLLGAFNSFGSSYVLESATQADASKIAELHRDVRLVTDHDNLPEYTQAAIQEGYFDKYWGNCLGNSQPSLDEKTIKVTLLNEAVAFVRFGAIEKPKDILDDLENGQWSELHQIYILPEHQNHGLGRRLFDEAAQELLTWGCDYMLINVLEGNHKARGFYEHQGACHLKSIVEQNTRNGAVYNVPCALYAYDLR